MCRAVGGLSAEMTGAVAATRELSCMCSWLSRKLVGLLAWQVERVVDSTLHREAEEHALSLAFPVCL